MKLAIITARLPTGSGETFLIPEIRQLQQAGTELVVIPLRRAGDALHLDAAVFPAIVESLLSWRVLTGAFGTLVRNPGRTLPVILRLLRFSRGAARAQLLAAIPKMLWLSAVVGRHRIRHIHAYWASSVATVAMGAAEIAGIPWSFTAHRYEIVANEFLDEKSRSAAFVRSISLAGIAAAESSSHEFARKACVLHLGVDVPDGVSAQKHDRFDVLCPAAFRPVKGHDVLIEGFSSILRRHPKARLLLAGEGRLRAKMESLVKTRGLSDRILFLGILAHEELLSLYASGEVNAVALASYDTGDGLPEGIPVALMEAMAYGLPVVATDAGGTAELLKDGAGILVPQRDPDALARALLHVAEDRGLCVRLGRLGRARVVAEFDVKPLAREFLRRLCGSDEVKVR